MEDLLRLFTEDVAQSELEMNITMTNITENIQNTKKDIENIISNTKLGIEEEKRKLADLEDAASGKSLIKKKSIADCLEKDRIQTQMINTTESIIYSVCRADLSLLLVKLSVESVEHVSKKLQKKLDICLHNFTEDCEEEKSCVIKTLTEINDEVRSINSKVEKRLKGIKSTSQICADGKKAVIISLIKEQEDKFSYCVDQIFNA